MRSTVRPLASPWPSPAPIPIGTATAIQSGSAAMILSTTSSGTGWAFDGSRLGSRTQGRRVAGDQAVVDRATEKLAEVLVNGRHGAGLGGDDLHPLNNTFNVAGELDVWTQMQMGTAKRVSLEMADEISRRIGAG